MISKNAENFPVLGGTNQISIACRIFKEMQIFPAMQFCCSFILSSPQQGYTNCNDVQVYSA